MNCPNCGSEIKEGKKFCVKCGTMVEWIERTGESTPAEVGETTGYTRESKQDSGIEKATKRIVGIVAALVVVFAIIVAVAGEDVDRGNGRLRVRDGDYTLVADYEEIQKRTDDGKYYLTYIENTDVTIKTSNENLKNNIDEWNQREKYEFITNLTHKAYETYDGLNGDYSSTMEWYGLDMDVVCYGDRYVFYNRCDDTVCCIGESIDTEICTDDNGSYIKRYVTFDVESGKQLTLSDLCPDYSKSLAFFRDYCYETIEGVYYLPGPDFANCINNGKIQWMLEEDGVTLIANSGVVAPISSGNVEVCIPYEELEGYIYDKYIP